MQLAAWADVSYYLKGRLDMMVKNLVMGAALVFLILALFLRLKLALAEDVPTIRVYDEAVWAELPDARAPVEISLALLERLHERWVYLWRALREDDWRRRFRHPELGNMDVDRLLALYAWHGPHHVAHITGLRTREGW